MAGPEDSREGGLKFKFERQPGASLFGIGKAVLLSLLSEHGCWSANSYLSVIKKRTCADVNQLCHLGHFLLSLHTYTHIHV